MTDAPATKTPAEQAAPEGESDYRFFDWEGKLVRVAYGGLDRAQVWGDGWRYSGLPDSYNMAEISEEQAAEMAGDPEALRAPNPEVEDAAHEDNPKDKAEDKGEGQDGG